MSQPAVIVPLAISRCPHRRAAWVHVRGHLAGLGWPVMVGAGDEELWSKGAACARAVAALEAVMAVDVLVVYDGDVLVPAEALVEAVTAVSGGAPWAVAHEWVDRLDQRSTVALLAGEPSSWTLDRMAYRGVVGGGCTIVRRDVWESCPIDPRFVGWGGEDEAWGWALDTLYGPPWAGEARLTHLWHPHAAPGARRPPHAVSLGLRRAYQHARGVPRLTRAVIADVPPAPRARLEEPARFVTTSGLRTFNVLGQLVRFSPEGEYLTRDSDAAEILDRHPGVARAG